MEYSFRNAALIGLTAASGYILGFSYGFRDWKSISFCSAIGSALGARYAEKGYILLD